MAGRTDATEVPGSRGGRAVFHDAARRSRRSAAGQAVNFARAAWPLGLFTARPQERHQCIPLKESRLPTVDRLKTLLAPGTDSVWVYLEQARDLIDHIRPMNFDEPVVRVSRAHPSALAHGRSTCIGRHIGGRLLRLADPGHCPIIKVGRRVNRVAPGLAKNRASPDHRQLGQPLPRTGKAITTSYVLGRFSAAEIPVAASWKKRMRYFLHRFCSAHRRTFPVVAVNHLKNFRGPKNRPEISPIL